MTRSDSGVYGTISQVFVCGVVQRSDRDGTIMIVMIPLSQSGIIISKMIPVRTPTQINPNLEEDDGIDVSLGPDDEFPSEMKSSKRLS
jgi:hypothetical protein